MATEQTEAKPPARPPTTPVPPPPTKDVVAVEKMWFVEALDLAFSEQKTSVTCAAEFAPSGSTYVCRYLPSLNSFELLCARNGTLGETRMIPRERVKQWTRLVVDRG